MAVRWKIPFKTLRSNELLTVNIYDSTFSGEAMVLRGAAEPFETQEEGGDDLFTPVRLQSGYLRIVDNGFAADGVTAFNWRDFIPTTDTDRPVTLTDASDNVLWQGFLQAQNFGATLFGNPQTREFPIQCGLSVTQGIDINFSQKEIRNFAYLIKQIVDSIPATCRPTHIMVQGDAFIWLPKTIDWQLFADVDDEFVPVAKYKAYDCLEEMCKFWGWTARTAGQTLYLLCPDDASVPRLFNFTYAQLSTLADDGSVEIAPEPYTSIEITGGFADNTNKDYQMRGASKAVFGGSFDNADKEVINVFDHRFEIEMENEDWTYGHHTGESEAFGKTGDIYSVDRLGFFASVVTSQLGANPASFNRLKQSLGESAGWGYGPAFNVIMIKRGYSSSAPAILTMQTKYMHSFSDGFFRFLGDTYIGADKFQEGNYYAGNWDMFVKFGVGTSRETAMWWDGRAWSSTEVFCRLTLGNKKPELFSRYVTGSGFDLQYEETSIINTATMYGYIYLEFYGSDNMPESDGVRAFNIGDFRLEFQKNNTVTKEQVPNSGWWVLTDKELEMKPYKSENANAIADEYSSESIFVSEKTMEPGYGIVLNANGSYLTTIPYAGTDAHPEQHFIDRVTSYWSASKRKIEANLLTHDGSAATDAAGVNPAIMVEIDGTKLHPVAIDRKWRDDVMSLVCMEMPDTQMVVITNLENVTSNAPDFVDYGDSLTVLLTGTGDNRVQANSVVVTMNGLDITSSAYNHSTKTITIASVTGFVSITAIGRPYDAEVEYLQSDGTAYINTGVVLTKNFEAEIDITPISRTTYAFVLGAYSSPSGWSTAFAYNTNGNAYIQIGSSWVDFTDKDYVDGIRRTYICRADGSKQYLSDGTNSGNNTISGYISSLPSFLFARNSGSGADRQIVAKLWSAKIKINGALTLDYIPVRKDGVGYLYDKVSGELFGNGGSGAFTYGSDK